MDECAQAGVEKGAQAFPAYGIRRFTAQVQRVRHGFVIGCTRARHVVGSLGCKRRPKARICRTTNRRHAFAHYPNLVAALTVTALDEICLSDITAPATRGLSLVALTGLTGLGTIILTGENISDERGTS